MLPIHQPCTAPGRELCGPESRAAGSCWWDTTSCHTALGLAALLCCGELIPFHGVGEFDKSTTEKDRCRSDTPTLMQVYRRPRPLRCPAKLPLGT